MPDDAATLLDIDLSETAAAIVVLAASALAEDPASRKYVNGLISDAKTIIYNLTLCRFYRQLPTPVSFLLYSSASHPFRPSEPPPRHDSCLLWIPPYPQPKAWRMAEFDTIKAIWPILPF